MKLKSNVKVLRVVESEAPELLAEAISDELFDKVRVERIPVLIKKIIGSHRGHCDYESHREGKEITISSELFDVRSERLRPNQIREIINVYLHECAHRLLPEPFGHDAAFLCLNMILHLRAGDHQIHLVNIYDAHQEKYFKDAWTWAWTLADELYKTDNTAEQCAQIITSKYKPWVEWMDGAYDRAAELHARKALAIDQRNKAAQANENIIKSLKQDRWLCAFYSAVATILTLNYFN